MKSLYTISFIVFLVVSFTGIAQENVFLQRDYWKNDPSVEKIKTDIKTGNNPSQLNRNAFDAVVYALLENTNERAIKYLLSLEGNDVKKRTHDSRTYIFWAAYKGNTDIMEHLFDKGAVINITDSHGNTPVTFAASTGQKSMAVYDLFEKHGTVLSEEKNKDGVNALFLIAPYLDTEKELAYFINKGFDIKATDPIGNTIFNYAARKGNVPFLKLLIEKGVNPNVINREGGNAILYASQGMRRSQNGLDTYTFLEDLGVKTNVVGDRGRNPLHAIAYKSDDPAIFSYFIERGVDVNLQDKGGDSPFMNAANSNELKIVQFLCNHLKDINAKDEDGRSALAMAVNRNSLDVVAFLLKKGADIQTKDKEGNSLAYYVLNTFRAKDSEVFEAKLKLLQKNGLSMNQTQQEGNTLVHIAAQRNNLTLLKRLETFDIDVNAKNNEGFTALHIAAMKAENDEILKYLLNLGADKTIKTEFDETVLDLASENELLQKQNIQLNFLK